MSPALFNIILKAVIQKWYVDVMDDVTAVNAGLSGEDVGRLTSLFYANDGAVGSLDPEWL